MDSSVKLQHWETLIHILGNTIALLERKNIESIRMGLVRLYIVARKLNLDDVAGAAKRFEMFLLQSVTSRWNPEAAAILGFAMEGLITKMKSQEYGPEFSATLGETLVFLDFFSEPPAQSAADDSGPPKAILSVSEPDAGESAAPQTLEPHVEIVEVAEPHLIEVEPSPPGPTEATQKIEPGPVETPAAQATETARIIEPDTEARPVEKFETPAPESFFTPAPAGIREATPVSAPPFAVEPTSIDAPAFAEDKTVAFSDIVVEAPLFQEIEVSEPEVFTAIEPTVVQEPELEIKPLPRDEMRSADESTPPAFATVELSEFDPDAPFLQKIETPEPEVLFIPKGTVDREATPGSPPSSTDELKSADESAPPTDLTEEVIEFDPEAPFLQKVEVPEIDESYTLEPNFFREAPPESKPAVSVEPKRFDAYAPRVEKAEGTMDFAPKASLPQRVEVPEPEATAPPEPVGAPEAAPTVETTAQPIVPTEGPPCAPPSEPVSVEEMRRAMDNTQWYEELLRHDPGSRVFLPLAEEYCKLEKWREAVDVCRRGLTYDPRNTKGRVLLGWALWKLGESDEAERLLDEARRELEGSAVVYRLLSEIADRKGRSDLANTFRDTYNVMAPDRPTGVERASTGLSVGRVEGEQAPEPELSVPGLSIEPTSVSVLSEAGESSSRSPDVSETAEIALSKWAEQLSKRFEASTPAPGEKPNLFSQSDREELKRILRSVFH